MSSITIYCFLRAPVPKDAVVDIEGPKDDIVSEVVVLDDRRVMQLQMTLPEGKTWGQFWQTWGKAIKTTFSLSSQHRTEEADRKGAVDVSIRGNSTAKACITDDFAHVQRDIPTTAMTHALNFL